MHIEEKTELIRSMVRFQDGEVLGDNFIKYFDLLLKIHKGNQGVERTLKYMSRWEALLDLEEL